MRAIIYFLAGAVLVAAAAVAIAYGSHNLSTPSEAGVALEAPTDSQPDSHGSYGQIVVPANTQDCVPESNTSYYSIDEDCPDP